VADFTNAVVVMTSNLGAEQFGKTGFGLREAAGATGGGGDGDGDPGGAAAHFTEAVRDFLRPELFNRIDRIVPFLPLGPAAVERIVRRELTWSPPATGCGCAAWRSRRTTTSSATWPPAGTTGRTGPGR
jgi:ATP-dependent Clp protease ATP-binding subunit ClpA